MLELQNKICVVTGSSSGIGFAQYCHAEGSSADTINKNKKESLATLFCLVSV
jgi:NAD(P)-dependent dehydrogenase (short-subunit alcohol dehydrogenase family)